LAVHVDDDAAVLVRQRHALSAGDDLGGVTSGDGKTGRPADGHRVTRRRRPEAETPADERVHRVRLRGARFHAGKAHCPFDGRAAARRARRARQPRLQYGLVTERHVAVYVIVVVVVAGPPVAGRHGPRPVAGRLEPVAAVVVAVAAVAAAFQAARVRGRGGLAREHRD